MYKNERENEILKLLVSEGYATVHRLSELLYTSESSIRRDLASLESQGTIVRSYGGAELKKNASQPVPFSSRAHYNIAAKKKMAAKASHFIQDGDIIFLDQSSSAFYVAYELPKKSDITVITNNIEIMTLLAPTDVEVISSGGRLSKSNRNCLLGMDAHKIFSEVRANLLFFSAKALTADGTIYDCVREEVCIRNTMLGNADRRIFLCDSDKFNTNAPYRQCTLNDVDYMISENGSSPLKPGDQCRAVIL